ncbi:alpha/beta fold hydrolase [Methanolobus sp. ZRKC3]|uniref:alpha/beta fold hydrolase n=1 Tax=Methanolobus sp. ZRKC3 TaxID=3125786 RepID=UPI003255CCC9
MKFEVNKKLFPFESKFITLSNGEKIHYVDEGEGQTLLMFHGNPTWSFLYRKMISGLKGDFRCVAFDYPGFGLSEAPGGYDFLPETHSRVSEEFIKELGLKDVIIVCQDWGGPIGLGWAGRNPDKIKAAVIGNTWAWPLAGKLRYEAFSWIMGGPIGQWLGSRSNMVWNFFMKEGFMNKPDEEVLAMYRAPFENKKDRIQTAIFPRQLIKAKSFEEEVEKGLQKIKDIPVLFTWGTEDFAFREAERKRFQNIFKNHETVLLHASHFWQDEAAESASKSIIEWYNAKFS